MRLGFIHLLYDYSKRHSIRQSSSLPFQSRRVSLRKAPLHHFPKYTENAYNRTPHSHITTFSQTPHKQTIAPNPHAFSRCRTPTHHHRPRRRRPARGPTPACAIADARDGARAIERIHSHRTRVVDAMKHRRRRRDDAWNGVSLLTRPRHTGGTNDTREAWEMEKTATRYTLCPSTHPARSPSRRRVFSSSSSRTRVVAHTVAVVDPHRRVHSIPCTRDAFPRALYPTLSHRVRSACRTTRRRVFPRRHRAVSTH